MTPGDPVTDHFALSALVARKGQNYYAMVRQMNERFGSKYSPIRTTWLEMDRGHRERAVAGLCKMPDVPTETPDAVSALADRLARVRGVTAVEVLDQWCRDNSVSVASLEQLTQDSLRLMAREFRALLGKAAAARAA